MTFKMKYTIEKDYIKSGTKRRSGLKIVGGKPKFGVLHDTGNPSSTARGNVNYYKNSANAMEASAHTFVDDKHIIECIPMTTGTPEKAWHVIYNVTTDNQMFGGDANDIAVGIELCFGNNINFEEAYKRYVWYSAYCAYKFGFNPNNFVGHHILDPKRKTDPVNALKRYGKTYDQLLKDIVKEYYECLNYDKKEENKEEVKLPKRIVDKDVSELEFVSPTLKERFEMRVISPATKELLVTKAIEELGYKKDYWLPKFNKGEIKEGDYITMAYELAVHYAKYKKC